MAQHRRISRNGARPWAVVSLSIVLLLLLAVYEYRVQINNADRFGSAGVSGFTELIIVPGHGVWMDTVRKSQNESIILSDASWIGAQPGEGPFLAEHAKCGVAAAVDRKSAMLVFSGGQTQKAAGRRSEALSYSELAARFDWWGHGARVRGRVRLEEYGRDSLENLVFSIALFAAETGELPDKVSVCGWSFKKARFELHGKGIGLDMTRFQYMGVNMPRAGPLRKAAVRGEEAKVHAMLTANDLLLTDSKWRKQRKKRNPFHRKHPYGHVHPLVDRILARLATS